MTEPAKELIKCEGKMRLETNWPRVLLQLHIHIFLTYGIYFFFQAKLFTVIFTLLLMAVGLIGTTAGSHRLWAHRSYSAHIILRVLLMICQTLSWTGPIYDWVLDHRIHHKYHGTNDDQYNYKRGFFFAQMGTRITKPNPKREQLEKEIDMSDLDQDKVVMFQRKFYWILMPAINILLPINAPVEYWDENMLISVMVLFLFRIPVLLHCVWLVNSGRSIWGLELNDTFYSNSNWVFIIKKNHWHEYHYNAPWDCLTGEFGTYNSGCTTAFIKIWAIMGLASGLNTVGSKEVTSALKKSIETGKPINNCLVEMKEQMQLQKYEETSLL